MMFVRTVLLGATGLALVACGDGGGFPDARPIDAPPPNGTFSVAWTVTDAGGTTIPCDRIGAQSVTVLLHEKGTQGGFTEAFTCGTGMGSASIAPGTYDVDYELHSPTGILARAPQQKSVVITSEQTTTFTPLVFAVDATGGLDLGLSAIDSGAPIPNCSGVASITTMTVTLETTAAVCQPVTFNISAGATGTAGTYVVNCATPALVNCLNSDQRLTVTGVPSGNYRIHVRGNKAGGDNCWINDDVFSVPPLGATLTRTLNLVHQPAVTGCN